MHLRRIARDLKQLRASPLANATAEPWADEDLTQWRGAIGIEARSERFVIPFRILFPDDYPRSAPSVGFDLVLPYHEGASYTNTSPGWLHDSFSICLDLLGNFAHVHTEWKAQEGAWSGRAGGGVGSGLCLSPSSVFDELNLQCTE